MVWDYKVILRNNVSSAERQSYSNTVKSAGTNPQRALYIRRVILYRPHQSKTTHTNRTATSLEIPTVGLGQHRLRMTAQQPLRSAWRVWAAELMIDCMPVIFDRKIILHSNEKYFNGLVTNGE